MMMFCGLGGLRVCWWWVGCLFSGEKLGEGRTREMKGRPLWRVAFPFNGFHELAARKHCGSCSWRIVGGIHFANVCQRLGFRVLMPIFVRQTLLHFFGGAFHAPTCCVTRISGCGPCHDIAGARSSGFWLTFSSPPCIVGADADV